MRPRILIVDDDAAIGRIQTAVLNKLGYDAMTVMTAGEAVKLYGEAMPTATPFNAVIIDLTLGEGVSGLDVMKDLRKLDPAVRGILSTGGSYQTTADACRDAGFMASLPKPFRIQDVSACLEEVLGKTPYP